MRLVKIFFLLFLTATSNIHARPNARSNQIDFLTEEYFKRHGVKQPALVSDEVFIRRAYFDVWGLPPAPKELEKFLKDKKRGKRVRLVDFLLNNSRNYSEHWISFWNDLLRNDEGVIYHGDRQPITPWLLKALEENMPYDQFVSSLLNPRRDGDPEGFLIGVNWRGTVSASQTPVMQAAQNSAQVFLGINLKCASCHDSFVSKWKLADAYGLANFFADGNLELYRCDISTGQKASPKFLFPELPLSATGETLAERRAAATRLFTAPENRYFSHTLVNRYWKRLLGRGLVEPADEMDSAKPWDHEILGWLAQDFANHGYDLKFLIRRIMTSRAYQFPALDSVPNGTGNYVFWGPILRRLTAEQFIDSISVITGILSFDARANAPGSPGRGRREWRDKSNSLSQALGRPIRDQVVTQREQEATTLQAIELANGEALASRIRQGAEGLFAESKNKDPKKLIERIYQHALSRKPSPEESRLAREFLGEISIDSISDFLWTMLLSPEFQYIQ